MTSKTYLNLHNMFQNVAVSTGNQKASKVSERKYASEQRGPDFGSRK